MNSNRKRTLAGTGIAVAVLMGWLLVHQNHKLLTVNRPSDLPPDIAAARSSGPSDGGDVLGASTNAAQNPLRNLYVNPFR